MSLHNRENDLEEFFGHEIQSYPPSLSDFGKIHLSAAKSDLLKCLKQPDLPDTPSNYDCKVLDGAVIVHSLQTAGASTFDDYARSVFIPYVEQQLKNAKRLDVIWDSYTPLSLKEATREK